MRRCSQPRGLQTSVCLYLALYGGVPEVPQANIPLDVKIPDSWYCRSQNCCHNKSGCGGISKRIMAVMAEITPALCVKSKVNVTNLQQVKMAGEMATAYLQADCHKFVTLKKPIKENNNNKLELEKRSWEVEADVI